MGTNVLNEPVMSTTKVRQKNVSKELVSIFYSEIGGSSVLQNTGTPSTTLQHLTSQKSKLFRKGPLLFLSLYPLPPPANYAILLQLILYAPQPGLFVYQCFVRTDMVD
jgi:hypothetical protein